MILDFEGFIIFQISMNAPLITELEIVKMEPHVQTHKDHLHVIVLMVGLVLCVIKVCNFYHYL